MGQPPSTSDDYDFIDVDQMNQHEQSNFAESDLLADLNRDFGL